MEELMRLLIAFCIPVLALLFQNCSEMQFTKNPAILSAPVDDQLVVEEPGGPGGSSEEGDPEGPSDPGDPGDPGDIVDNPPEEPTDPGDEGDPPGGGGGDSHSSCGDFDIARVLLNVNRVEIKPSNLTLAVAASSVFNVLDLDTTGFRFGPLTETVKARQIRVVLNDFGNKIITTADSEVGLKTPSAQNSGLKLLLSSNLTLEAGKSYVLKADSDLQILKFGNKCMLHPVIKITSVEEALD
jgi:hypothetical protein